LNRSTLAETEPSRPRRTGYKRFFGEPNGRFTVWRLTTAKQMRTALKAIRLKLLRRRHEPIAVLGTWLRRVVQGYFNYHAVPGNIVRLSRFRDEVSRAWLFVLRRRSQRPRMPWVRFNRLVARYLAAAQVLHPYPNQRFALWLAARAVCSNPARTDLCGGAAGNRRPYRDR
jgi:hypothetical protein